MSIFLDTLRGFFLLLVRRMLKCSYGRSPAELPRSEPSGTGVASGVLEATDSDVEIITRYSDKWNRGVASWSEEEKVESPDDPVSDCSDLAGANPVASSSASSAIRGPLKFASRKVVQRKYGRCSKHGKAYRLHLVKSGRSAGTFWARCPEFWSRLQNGQPGCWSGHPFRGSPDDLPASALRMQRIMKKDIKFQVLHGPQSKPP